jgi:hypothetical protein
MKAKGWIYCGGTGGGVESCRQETSKPHWHPVYESCFEATAELPEKEISFIDWDKAIFVTDPTEDK